MIPVIRLFLALALGLAGMVLTGCDLRQRLQSPEDRINAAVPIGIVLEQSRQRLVDELGPESAQRSAVQAAWAARLRARALSCSPDFSPSWRQSVEEVRASVGNRKCFSDFDRTLAWWIGVQRVRLQLERAPAALGVIPASITLPGTLPIGARDQGRSPVVAVNSTDGLELVALDGGSSPFKESGGRGEVNVSPNGRIFAQTVGNLIRIRVTDGGETLLEIPEAQSLQWLSPALLAVRANSGKPGYVVSLRSGTQAPVLGPSGMSFDVFLPVPRQPDRFDVVGVLGLYQYEAVDREGKLVVTVVQERPGADLRLMVMGARGGQISADRNEWIAGIGQKLVRLDLSTLEIREHLFGPVTVSGVTTTAQLDQFIVSLQMRGASEGPLPGSGNYLFDATAGTLARVTGAADQRDVRYFPAIGRLAHLSHPTLWLSERLDTSEPVPVRDVIASLIDESNQSKLAQVAAQEQRLAQSPPLLSTSMVVPDVRDAQLEGVGVYEAREKVAQPGDSRSIGRVEVKLRRSSRPLVLVLTSYEPVEWVLRPEPGAKLGAVLLGGYYESRVVGAGSARVLKIGRTYAYSHDGAEFAALQREVTRWAGRPMTLFQGAYRGDSYTVGGLTAP